MRHPTIGDHELVGGLPSAAAVATEGTLDRSCSPRSGPPSAFASLLDSTESGWFGTGSVEASG
jgi:hypothetical protein